ncbi:MAG: hypothetical protein R3F15_00770 [Lysobacterales bacterium]
MADNSDYAITQAKLEELAELYEVDVPAQLRAMAGWLLGNPKRRKTRSGVMRFVTGWLAREQNAPRPTSTRFDAGARGGAAGQVAARIAERKARELEAANRAELDRFGMGQAND